MFKGLVKSYFKSFVWFMEDLLSKASNLLVFIFYFALIVILSIFLLTLLLIPPLLLVFGVLLENWFLFALGFILLLIDILSSKRINVEIKARRNKNKEFIKTPTVNNQVPYDLVILIKDVKPIMFDELMWDGFRDSIEKNSAINISEDGEFYAVKEMFFPGHNVGICIESCEGETVFYAYTFDENGKRLKFIEPEQYLDYYVRSKILERFTYEERTRGY